MRKIFLLIIAAMLCTGYAFADESTTYYVNEGNGIYYHANPICASVSEQYLPMTEVSDLQNDLLPCPACVKTEKVSASDNQAETTSDNQMETASDTQKASVTDTLFETYQITFSKYEEFGIRYDREFNMLYYYDVQVNYFEDKNVTIIDGKEVGNFFNYLCPTGGEINIYMIYKDGVLIGPSVVVR